MKTFLFLLVLLVGIGTAVYVYQGEMLPVEQIQIDGDLQHINMVEVEQIIMQYVQHGLLRTNIGEMQRALTALPWVGQARVSRVWPNTVHIWLEEPQAVAVWADSGIVSQDGQVFYLPRDTALPTNLPIFEGIEGQVPLMLKEYQQMQAILTPLNLSITRVILSPRYAWEVVLNNGMTLRLGKQQVLERLQRFTKVYPQLAEKQQGTVEYIDLRYPNGFAVKARPILEE
jgi:cell division protein FtsQ